MFKISNSFWELIIYAKVGPVQLERCASHSITLLEQYKLCYYEGQCVSAFPLRRGGYPMDSVKLYVIVCRCWRRDELKTHPRLPNVDHSTSETAQEHVCEKMRLSLVLRDFVFIRSSLRDLRSVE